MTFPRPFYRWRPHPWHGLEVGEDPPRLVQAYIEITPFDGVKYEIDKSTGYLRVDWRQGTSSSTSGIPGQTHRHTTLGTLYLAMTWLRIKSSS